MAETNLRETLQTAGRGDKRAIVLSEAIDLFNDHGYYDTRLEDVAERLGTAKTSISYHFKSKETLLFEAYAATCDFADEAVAQAAREATGLDRVLVLLRSVARAHASAIMGRRMPLAVVNDTGALREGDMQTIEQRLNAYADTLKRFVVEGQADGSIRVASVEASVFFLLSIQRWVRHWLQNVIPAHHDRAIEMLLVLLRDGLSVLGPRSLRTASPQLQAETENFLFDREARNRMKLEAFLRVGTRHFNLRGYRHLSVNDVAGELGVSRGVFYYHFEDKDDLLRSCARRSLDIIENSIQAHQEEDADALEKLHMSLSSLFEGHLNDLNPLLRQSLFASIGERDRPVIMARSRRVTAGFGELIALGVSEGSIRAIDLEAIEHLVCGAVFGATRQRLGSFGLGAEAGVSVPKPIAAADYFEPLFFGLSAPR